MRFVYPFEITKLYATKDKEPDKVDTEISYAFAIQENFDTIRKYLNEIITGENLTTLAKKNTITLIPQDAVLPTTSAPALVKIDGTYHSYNVLDFDSASAEVCYWHFTLPANCDEGNITISIKYIANATTGNVLWMIYLKGISETESIDQSPSSISFVADTVNGTVNTLCVASKTFLLPVITAGEWLILGLVRDAGEAGDSLAVDARVLEVALEWNLD